MLNQRLLAGISLVGTGSGSNGNSKYNDLAHLVIVSGARLEYSDSSNYLRIGTTSASGSVQLMSGNGVICMFRIGNTGDVGIGTTTPSAKLDVQGTQGQLFSVTDNLSGEIFAVADISGVPIMTVNSSGVSYFAGNVGIGSC